MFVWWMNSQAYTNLLEVRTSVTFQPVGCILYKNLFQMCCTPTCTPSHTAMHKCMFVWWTFPSMASQYAIKCMSKNLFQLNLLTFLAAHTMRRVWSYTWQVGKLQKFVQGVFVVCTPTCAPSYHSNNECGGSHPYLFTMNPSEHGTCELSGWQEICS